MSGAKLDWKGTGRYDWRAEWPDGWTKDGRRVVVIKLVALDEAGAAKPKLIFVR